MVADIDEDVEDVLSQDDVMVEVGRRGVHKRDLTAASRAAEQVAAIVTPARLFVASITLLLLVAIFGAFIYYIVPQDRTEVRVVFMQSSAGHVVLTEILNKGSREISDVSLFVEVTKLDGSALNSTQFDRSSLQSHTSLTHDDLELIVEGASGWEEYLVHIELSYTDATGDPQEAAQIKRVGEWITEEWRVGQGYRLILW